MRSFDIGVVAILDALGFKGIWLREDPNAVFKCLKGGVCRAARYAVYGQTRVLAIRGVSDIIGYKRAAEWTDFACRSAAAFADALIPSGLIPRRD